MYEAKVEYLEEKEKRFEQKIMYGGMDILWNNTIWQMAKKTAI